MLLQSSGMPFAVTHPHDIQLPMTLLLINTYSVHARQHMLVTLR